MTRRIMTLVILAALILGAGQAMASPFTERILAVDLSGGGLGKLLTDASATDVYIATNLDELINIDLADFGLIIFAYHELSKSPDTVEAIKEYLGDVMDWIKAGGGILAVTRDDPADNVLLGPFGLRYSGANTAVAPIFDITVPDHPIFTTPNKIDSAKLKEEIQNTSDPSYVDVGLSCDNPAFTPIANFEGTDDPVIFVGEIGRGRVIFSTVEVLYPVNATPTDLLLVNNMLHWAAGK